MLRRADYATEAEFREAQRQAKNAYMRRYNNSADNGLRWTVAAGRNIVETAEPADPEALAERARAQTSGHQSIVAAVAGDPLPGRSALDRLRRRPC